MLGTCAYLDLGRFTFNSGLFHVSTPKTHVQTKGQQAIMSTKIHRRAQLGKTKKVPDMDQKKQRVNNEKDVSDWLVPLALPWLAPPAQHDSGPKTWGRAF